MSETARDDATTPEDAAGSDPEWRAGAAKASITPDADEPHVLYGFGGRPNEPMDGVEHDIHARAVALEDRTGRRLVFLSFELMAVYDDHREWLEAECEERWGVEPEALVVNPTHTHYAPRYHLKPGELDDDADEADRLAASYREMVDETLLSVIDEAMADLEPAELGYYHAKCGMAMCRRRPAEDLVHFDANPDGPVDHDVPVLAVSTPDLAADEPKAVIFGYACHPTVGGGDWNEVSGDWPGYAMEYVEEEHPGAVAMFLIGCAGDQKAYPQGTREWVRRHGRTAANAVERALVTDTVGNRKEPTRVRGPLTVVADEAVLDLREEREHEDGESGEADVVKRRHPIQAINFGDDLTMLAMGGEVVADISNELKETLRGPLWTVGYSAWMGYIVTPRILAEGGSEARSSGMRGYRYAPDTADRVVRKATALAERAGSRRQ